MYVFQFTHYAGCVLVLTLLSLCSNEVLEGEFTLADHVVTYSSGTAIAKFPEKGLLVTRDLQDQGAAILYCCSFFFMADFFQRVRWLTVEVVLYVMCLSLVCTRLRDRKVGGWWCMEIPTAWTVLTCREVRVEEVCRGEGVSMCRGEGMSMCRGEGMSMCRGVQR